MSKCPAAAPHSRDDEKVHVGWYPRAALLSGIVHHVNRRTRILGRSASLGGVALAVLMLAACGSAVKAGPTSPLRAPATSPSATSTPPANSTHGGARNFGTTTVADVCSLVSDRQIGAALGGTWVPVTFGGLANGYVPRSFLATLARHSWVHELDPALNVQAYATCSWQDKSVSDGGAAHPAFQQNLVTFNGNIPEAVFLRKYAPTKPYPSGFSRIAGLGQWTFYDQPASELDVGAGNMLLVLSEPDIDPEPLGAPYTQLARAIVSRLG